jgi:hypothetical protein
MLFGETGKAVVYPLDLIAKAKQAGGIGLCFRGNAVGAIVQVPPRYHIAKDAERREGGPKFVVVNAHDGPVDVVRRWARRDYFEAFIRGDFDGFHFFIKEALNAKKNGFVLARQGTGVCLRREEGRD